MERGTFGGAGASRGRSCGSTWWWPRLLCRPPSAFAGWRGWVVSAARRGPKPRPSVVAHSLLRGVTGSESVQRAKASIGAAACLKLSPGTERSIATPWAPASLRFGRHASQCLEHPGVLEGLGRKGQALLP